MGAGISRESATVPYGREIRPSARGGGKFSLPLPLKEYGEYDGFVLRGAWAKPEPVNEVAFELGWSPKPASLPPGIQPVEMNGETLWLLPYGLVTTIQRTAKQRLCPWMCQAKRAVDSHGGMLMAVFLEIVTGPQSGQRVEIADAGTLLVGRGSNSQLRISSDGAMSSVHFLIRAEQCACTITDQQEINGTSVNNIRGENRSVAAR